MSFRPLALLVLSTLCGAGRGFDFFGRRTFPPFVLPNQGSFTPLFPRLFSSTQFQEFGARITRIETQLSQNQPRCPSAAENANIVGDLCYSLSATANYGMASTRCFLNGGKLAEPNYEDVNFIRNISTAFPDDIQRATTGIIIGARSRRVDGEYVFVFDSTGVRIPALTDRVTSPTDEESVAVIHVPDTAEGVWTIEPDTLDQNHSFLCQYNII